MATWDADGKLPDHTALLGSSCSHRCVPVLAKVWPPDIDSVPHYGRYKHVVPWLQRLRRAMMTIGQAARQAGCGVETIRFYERQGLIERPAKPATGFRRYPSEIVDRVRFIRQAQGLGFSLREIDELLSLRTDPAADCADVRSRASAKLDEVARRIDQLERIREALGELIEACPGHGATRTCSILEALANSGRHRIEA